MKRIQIAQQLWNLLWQDYSARVEYATIYQQMILAAGGTVANDHIAFRSLRWQIETPTGSIHLGIEYLAKIAELLGYQPAGNYEFPEQKLYALHYRHPEQDRWDLPKLFISELVVDALDEQTRSLIDETVKSGFAENAETTHLIANLETEITDSDPDAIASQLTHRFIRPWQPPQYSVVEKVNAVSQYGAWVLLHGYAVNHFTGYVNRQNTPQFPDIETTAQGMRDRGVPMKAEIEGSYGSGLRQTATHAVKENVTVRSDRTELITIPWTYAYYEIAERNVIEINPGEPILFNGFLGSQAKNLFEMTRLQP